MPLLYPITAKKMEVSRLYQPDDWYKSEKSRMHILALVYASKSFLLVESHQPHAKAFMGHLESIATENPEYARDCGIDDIKWIDVKDRLKAMWRKYHNPSKNLRKRCKDFLSYSKTVYRSHYTAYN